MRPIAILLPQFHELEINNKWWGKGFTDWDKVKNARSLFDGHKQPIIPQNHIYYNLLDRETMEKQTEQMKDAGVFGMAYYHYWYDHEPVMEKPAENLLKWTDIDQKFLMYWSNCDWFYSMPNSYQRNMIFHQEYGDHNDWIKHIQYLIPFFKDKRYITVDKKPVLCIYRPSEIPHFDEMLTCFEVECQKAGLPGLYIIETLFNYGEAPYSKKSSAVMYREPNCCKKYAPSYNEDGYSFIEGVSADNIPNKVRVYEYEDACKCSVENQSKYTGKKKMYYGVFTGWDNTPRHGFKGFVIRNNTPEVFGRYVAAIGKLCDEDDFVFINAWNEWAEGMYMEPDENNGDGFIKVLKKIQSSEM